MMKKILKMYNPVGFVSYSVCPPDTSSGSPSVNSTNENTEDNADADYETWMVDHPSALREFEDMMNISKGKKILLFLDYDGTLSPIVNDPQMAFMSDSMRSALREVASYYPTSIISGRSRDKVYEFVQLDDVYYAGSHGMDILAPPGMKDSAEGFKSTILDKKGNEVMIFQPARDFLPEIVEISKELEEAIKDIEGAAVEDNRFCLSVHFRRVSEEDYSILEERVNAIIAQHPTFHLTRGRKVMEIRPSINWNKGNALEYLLETLGFADSDDVCPIYIGDDRTDEDAFEVVQRRGQGFSIVVSMKAKETRAAYSLRDPSEVLEFLVILAKWRGNMSS